MPVAWIVDDDREMCEAIALMLRVLDYDARYFLDARSAARALLAGERPQVLILDLNMPEVSGADLLEFLRSRKAWRDLPVVMLTSEFAETEKLRLLKMGANAYLTKPVVLEELQQALQSLTGG